MLITANVLSVMRGRKDLPENARAWLQVLACEDESIIGKKLILLHNNPLPPSIRKRTVVRLQGELTKVKYRPAVEVSKNNIVPNFTASSLQALLKVGVSLPNRDTVNEILNAEGTARIADILEELTGTEAGISAYITELCAIQYLFDKAGIGIDFDGVAEIYELLRYRASHNGKTVHQFITENPWVITQAEGLSFKAGEKLAKHLGKGIDNLALYAQAMAIVWNTARHGDCYIPFEMLFRRTRKTQEKFRLKPSRKYLRDILFKGEAAFGSRYGSATLCSSFKSSIIEERLPFYEGNRNAERKAENDAKAVYPVKVYFSERNAAHDIARHVSAGVTDLKDTITIPNNLDIYQKKAIRTALQHPVTVWIGHAGSGKTKALQALAKEAHTAGIPVYILAPTAVAADRAGAKLGVPCSTIHRFAGILPEENDLLISEPTENNKEQELVEGIILVDEVSMCDVVALSHLAHVLTPGAHLVLVGDPAQLPAVGPSGFFQQIIRNKPESIPVCELRGNHRAGETILDFANAVRKGKFILPESDKVQNTPGNETEALSCITKLKDNGVPLEGVLALAPTRTSTRILNAKLQHLWNPDGEPVESTIFRIGDPVICTRNDYIKRGDLSAIRHKDRDINIFNGYRGIITKQDDEGFYVRYTTPGGIKEVPYTAKESVHWLEPAYALTVHKAQGGESEYVVIICPERMNRAMLYTAVTRAKKQVILVGNKEEYRKAVDKIPIPPLTKFLQRFDEVLGQSICKESKENLIVI